MALGELNSASRNPIAEELLPLVSMISTMHAGAWHAPATYFLGAARICICLGTDAVPHFLNAYVRL